MNLRKVGLYMAGIGAVAQIVGITIDAVHRADDPTLAQRQGIFDLTVPPHALFFAGICLVVFGLALAIFGKQFDELYEPGHEVTVFRRLAQVLAPAGAVALIVGSAAAAGSSSLAAGSGVPAATPATQSVAATDTVPAHVHDASATATGDAAATGTATAHNHGDVVPGSATGSSPCEKASPTPASPGQVGSGTGGAATADAAAGEHGERGLVVQQPLTETERVALEAQMAQARTVVAKYPTVKDALAAGYSESTVYVPCIGAHYTNTALALRFDPAAPSELLYDGTSPNSKIVGLSYLVFHPGGAPDGFAGPNDHWHQHNADGGLCMRGGLVIGGETTSQAECTARGGAKVELDNVWMLHAWVVPGFECTWGVFGGECPELGGRTGGTAWDN